MIKGIIYKWTNKVNNKCYIGKTINEYKRKWEHLHDRRYKSAFHDALDKYGVEQFNYEVLVSLSSNDYEKINNVLNHLERFYIKKYNSSDRDCGYNLTDGGDGLIGRFGVLNPFYGKHHTEETKLKQSKLMSGRKQSEETIKKKSESLKKVVHTKDWNRKVGISNQKQVFAFKDGVLIGKYNCYNDCKNDLGLPNIKGISKVVRGTSKTYYGYYFKNTIGQNNEEIEDKD